MQYVGIQQQIRRNNFSSLLLLIAFPLLLLGMVYLFIFFTQGNEYQEPPSVRFAQIAPVVIVGTSIWFLFAWAFHTTLIKMATGSHSLERKENKRVYNLVENLCIAKGMKMPKINVIEDDSLNAFASGINEKTYTVSLSRGIIQKLDNEELEGVIAHELSHIRNRDVRLMIISIIFVGIFAFIAEMAFRGIRFAGRGRGKGNAPVILIAIVISAIAYLISSLLRFAISRSREFMADAGAAEMTRRPYALANALRKISADPAIEAVQSRDVAQLFIENPTPSKHGFSWDNLFATHPPIEKRIELLEQFV